MARVFIILLVVLAGMTLAAPTTGSAQQTGVAADIRQGNCDEPGDVVAPLDAATLPISAPRGNPAALPAASSFTTVPLSLQTLVTSDYSIAVPFPAGDELVACGEIGGALTEADSLVVGIRPRGELDLSGIAYLSQSSDPTRTNVSLFVSGEGLGLFLSATFSEPTVAEDDAARFAAALSARDRSPHLAGPFAGQLVLREGLYADASAGIAAADFSATVTIMNPTEQTEAAWSVGFAFHGTPDVARVITVDSGGTWTYQDLSTGTVGAGPLDTLDATPGATNSLDLVVEGTTALLGVNGELATRIDLPPPMASDVVLVSGGALQDRTITFTGFEVWGGPGTVAQASTPTAGGVEDDAALFAAALAARNGEPPLAGPFRGVIPQSMAGLAARPTGLVTEDFAATVTFVNPTPQAEAPWDGGLAFHLDPQAGTVQEVYFDSGGFWYYTDFPNGIQQSGIVPGFDTVPGGTNTLDLIVVGDTALFGMNGEFLARLELPPPVPSDVMAATNFYQGNLVEGREITFTGFAAWEAPDLASLPVTPATSAGSNDATRFADVLKARSATTQDAGPFADALVQRQGSLALWGSETTPAPFSATVTFANPVEQTETPWEVGFGFAWLSGQDVQKVYVDSDGFWSSGGTPGGFVPAFDTAPGATNTLDLVVEDDVALFGVNGAFVARLDLPTPPGSGLFVGTGFSSDHVAEGREIVFRDFTVWR